MNYIFRWLIFFLSSFLLVNSSLFANDGSDDFQKVTPEQRGRSLKVLNEVMINENGWVKIKAAKYLLLLNYSERVKQKFENELKELEVETEYRIGIWMILVKAS